MSSTRFRATLYFAQETDQCYGCLIGARRSSFSRALEPNGVRSLSRQRVAADRCADSVRFPRPISSLFFVVSEYVYYGGSFEVSPSSLVRCAWSWSPRNLPDGGCLVGRGEMERKGPRAAPSPRAPARLPALRGLESGAPFDL